MKKHDHPAPTHGPKQPERNDQHWSHKIRLYCDKAQSEIGKKYRYAKKQCSTAGRLLWKYGNADLVRNESATALFTGMLLITTCTYAYFSYLQWDETRKSADAATMAAKTAQRSVELTADNFRKDQRPYLALPELPQGAPNPGKIGVHEGRVRVLLPIQNYGKSPAINTFYFAKVAIGHDQIQRINFNLPANQDIGIMPPGVSPPISAFSEVLKSPDDTKRPMVVYGRIDYTDIFSPPKPKYSLVFCQTFNVEMTFVPSNALKSCNGKNYIK